MKKLSLPEFRSFSGLQHGVRQIGTFACIVAVCAFLSTPAHAIAPPTSTYLGDFFKLYRFLPPKEMQLYESEDMARKDIGQTILSQTGPKQGDECITSAPDQCKRSLVLQNEESPGNFVTQTLPHADGVCRAKKTAGSEAGDTGYCDYLKRPEDSVEITAVDYSKSHDLIFAKLQCRFCSYWHDGGTNVIASGSDNLSVGAAEQYARRATTLAQAAETGDTIQDSGEWALGGVNPDRVLDGEDPSSDQAVTLIEAWRHLEDDNDGKQLKFDAKLLRGDWENMVDPPPVDEDMSHLFHGAARQEIYQIVTRNQAKPEGQRPLWLKYFLKTPECGPGYDKGYVLISVCADGSCTLPASSYEQFIGKNPKAVNQTTYSDPGIRQNLCAAVHNVYQSYSLRDAQAIMREARAKNPLVPYTLLSNTKATPSQIMKHLSQTLGGDMVKNEFFSLMWFHKLINGWRSPDGGFWYVKFGYEFKRGGEYRGADAVEDNSLWGVIQNAISVILGKPIDRDFQGLHHKVLIPSLAAHSIDAIENATQIITQTSAQNKIDAEATADYNNGVQAGATILANGNKTAPAISESRLRLWACSDPLFSAAIKIANYISNGRVGCDGGNTTATPTFSTATCSTDTPEGVSADAKSAAAKVGAKYNIPPKWLEAMYVYEGGAKKLGAACTEEGGVNVVGPLQIASGTYTAVTCENERFSSVDQERTQCSNASKLSRCSIEGSFELAARVLLQKLSAYDFYSGSYDCKATKSTATIAQLYQATNAYSGCGSFAGKPYAQLICEYAGNCPDPLPKTGAPITCAGLDIPR